MTSHSLLGSGFLAILLVASACSASGSAAGHDAPVVGPAMPPGASVAVFSGGCFWCEEEAFEGVEGVYSVTSGFTGGRTVNPTYDEVSSGGTGHAESVKVVFDPKKISYARLLEIFWHNVDPLDPGGQFCDRGTTYRSGIHYVGDEQRKEAEASKAKLEQDPMFQGKIATEIVPAMPFFPAEEYHQDFYKKNAVRYHSYREGCGRDRRLRELWGEPVALHAFVPQGDPPARVFAKPSDSELKAKLTPLQYDVTQHEGTERPFANEYWDNHEPGIYVDRISGEPLFSSLDKFDSGTGWPSFKKPLVPANLKTGSDATLGIPRTEIRSEHADSHLGHVFDDGPPPTGLRYCVNSAALRFIPAAKLEEQGYGEFRSLLTKP